MIAPSLSLQLGKIDAAAQEEGAGRDRRSRCDGDAAFHRASHIFVPSFMPPMREFFGKLGPACKHYRTLFVEHAITPEHLPSLNEEDLRSMGVTLVGHQKSILACIRELEKSERRRVAASVPKERAISSWGALWSAFVTAHFVRIGEMSKSDAISLNTQLATVSALAWFASITFTVELGSIFDHASGVEVLTGDVVAEALPTWAYWSTFYQYLTAVTLSAMACIYAVHSNMVLLQVSEADFDDFMNSVGNRQQQVVCALFLVSLLFLISSYVTMIMFVSPWPANVVFIVVLTTVTLFLPPYFAILPTVQKIYHYQQRMIEGRRRRSTTLPRTPLGANDNGVVGRATSPSDGAGAPVKSATVSAAEKPETAASAVSAQRHKKGGR